MNDFAARMRSMDYSLRPRRRSFHGSSRASSGKDALVEIEVIASL